ncbi:hypothetical protein MMC10_011434 [Thelotrema lepadinum]|nr:hypothetical protein [Thelotrema lepadinum]
MDGLEFKKELTLHYDYCPMGFYDLGMRAPRWRASLESLTCLKISLPGYEEGFSEKNPQRYDRDVQDEPSLVSFMKAASKVKELDLKLTYDIETSNIFNSESNWPYLTKLKLSIMKFDTEDIFDFFDDHGASLEILDFRWVRLGRVTSVTGWTKFLERLRTESVHNLKSFRWSGLFEMDQYRCAVHDWRLCPDLIPSHRAARYLMCGEKTNVNDVADEITLRPYDWESISWESISWESIGNDEEVARQRTRKASERRLEAEREKKRKRKEQEEAKAALPQA